MGGWARLCDIHTFYLKPSNIMHCRSEVIDLFSGCCSDRGSGGTTDRRSLWKSQVDKEINQVEAGLDRWLTFGWWRALLFLWMMRRLKEGKKSWRDSCRGGHANTVNLTAESENRWMDHLKPYSSFLLILYQPPLSPNQDHGGAGAYPSRNTPWIGCQWFQVMDMLINGKIE